MMAQDIGRVRSMWILARCWCFGHLVLLHPRDGRQSVDTARVLVHLILPEPLRTFPVSPIRKLGPLALELVDRYAESAGVGDPMDSYDDDGAFRGSLRKEPTDALVLDVLWLQHITMAMEPYNSGWSLERAPHHDDSTIFFQVRDRFSAAAHVVQVSHFVGSKHPERIEAFWRHVDMARRIERSRRDKEHPLCLDEELKTSIDFVVQLSH